MSGGVAAVSFCTHPLPEMHVVSMVMRLAPETGHPERFLKHTQGLNTHWFSYRNLRMNK